MENQIFADTSLFLSSVILGFLFGIFYECFRFFRLLLPHSASVVALEDFLFFVPTTGIFLLFTYALSDGVVRWFSVFALIMGFFLYLKTLGKLLLSLSDAILRHVKRLLRWIFRKTIHPICNVFKNITKYLYARIKSIAIIEKEKAILRRLKKEKAGIRRAARQGFLH